MIESIAGISALIAVALFLTCAGSAAFGMHFRTRTAGGTSGWRSIAEWAGFSAAILAVVSAMVTLVYPQTAALYYGGLVAAMAAVVAAMQLD